MAVTSETLKEAAMSKIAIISCQKIKDKICLGCIKCFKAMALREGEFARYSDGLEVMAMTDCGDCPGLAIPKLALIKEAAQTAVRPFDVVHIGTCIVKARALSACPIDPEKLKGLIEAKLGVPAVIGTHPY